VSHLSASSLMVMREKTLYVLYEGEMVEKILYV
jgi:hypothetical protein